MSRLAIHIAHAAFLPERAQTLDRLLSQLAPQAKAHGIKVQTHRSEQREHASVWATRMYKVAALENADAAIFLNDDVEVSPDLVAAVDAMTSIPTSRMISLHTVHPTARTLAEAGQRWCRTYHLTGPGYVMRKGVAREVMAYYEAFPKSWAARVNEDNVLIQYAFRHREPIWNCIPGLVRHDTNVPSTLGYDDSPGRVCVVPWIDRDLFPDLSSTDLASSSYWRPEGAVPTLDTHWTRDDILLANEFCVSLGIDDQTCMACKRRPPVVVLDACGVRICGVCIHQMVGQMINIAIRATARS